MKKKCTKMYVPEDTESDPSYSDSISRKYDSSNKSKYRNQKANSAIERKIIRSAQNRTCQTNRQETLVCPTKVIIKSRNAIKRRSIVNGTLSSYAQN